jgi:hypothetical protein
MANPMSAIEELVNYLISFTPEQLQEFLNHETTLSILQPEAASESYHPGESLSA